MKLESKNQWVSRWAVNKDEVVHMCLPRGCRIRGQLGRSWTRSRRFSTLQPISVVQGTKSYMPFPKKWIQTSNLFEASEQWHLRVNNRVALTEQRAHQTEQIGEKGDDFCDDECGAPCGTYYAYPHGPTDHRVLMTMVRVPEHSEEDESRWNGLRKG